ncbi:MAG: nicotinate-nucleotide adenylyltransferase [Gammaproteobacteria bacterium]|nr:nicotinate-nucleotide adenylyltransferase [Gammaproteobacteria bacterium]
MDISVTDKLLGVFGGTFDPLHIGHLRTVLDVQQALALQQIRMLPNYIPAHRQKPVLEAQQRYFLLQKALKETPGLVADDREIRRQGISYMVDTLADLKQQFPQKHLCLIVGGDAYRDFCKWHQWQDILQLAHLLVMKRAGLANQQNKELQQRVTTDKNRLLSVAAGNIVFLDVCQLEISSTRIREMIRQKQSVQFLVPEIIRSDLQTLYEG